ncbi:MAG: hypothetical protein ACE5GC_01695 [Acidimicrobiia bacterium]
MPDVAPTGKHRSASRFWLRRFVVAAALAGQAFALFSAYGAPHTPFGWQMFPASAEWEADIVRVTVSGDRIDIRDPWPGGVVWSDVVTGHGLGTPFFRHHADHGVDATVDFLVHALDWIAANTPHDHDTVRLEIDLTYWDNGRGPFQRVLKSADRPEAAS